MIRVITVFLFIFALSFSSNAARIKQEGMTGLVLSQPTVETLKLAIAFGKRNQLKVADEDLHVFLYSIPLQGSCIPETHAVCGYRYLLMMYESDEFPEIHIYDLGAVGEIRKFDYRAGKTKSTIVFKIKTTNYPRSAFKKNKKLKRANDKFILTIQKDGKAVLTET